MDNSILLTVVSAGSAIIGIIGKTLVDLKKADSGNNINKRDDFTAVIEQMKYIIQKGEDKIDEQEKQMDILHNENVELKAMFIELRRILDTITIDPDVIEKINLIYEKLRYK